jgi:hypothetical protein
MYILAAILRAFARWFIMSFFAWFIKGAFDATVSPWLRGPLAFINARSSAAHARFRSKMSDLRRAYHVSLQGAAA